MAGSDDLWAWLQSIMPNQGAGQPYGPGTPTGGAGPQSLMPGGGVMGHGAATPGGPSMGYPAMGRSGSQPSPQPPAPSPLGYSLTANHGDGPADVMSPAAMYAAQGGRAQPPGSPGFNWPDSTNYGRTPPGFNWPDSSTPTGMPTPPGSPSATPRPANAPITPYDRRGPLASPDAAAASPMKRTAGAPDLGYYNNRFVPIDRPNAPAGGGGGMARGGPPQMSALNLAGLFNRGQQPGVNPNVPAANAQPDSAAAPGGQIASAGPTPYGPNTPRLDPSGLLALLGGNQPPNGYGSVPVPYPPQRPLGY